MWAAIGLGNPGKAYAETRHNTGFVFIKKIAREWGIDLKGKRFQAKTAEGNYEGERVLLVLPQTYMNNSGGSVRDLLKKTKLDPAEVIIIYDDLDIPLGDIRIRKQGGAGTHKGIQSIVQETGTTRFPRIRIGIGPLPSDVDAADFVLSPFTRTERESLAGAMDKARAALMMILNGQIEKAMTTYNMKEPVGPEPL